MGGWRLNSTFQELFFLFVFSGFVLGGAYLWIKLQVWKAGYRSSFFSLSHDTILFRRYRELAQAKRVPLWPLYLYWVALVVGVALGVCSMATFH